MSRKKENQAKVFRCAIYTRKSTEEGLEQEFNSLDAQRDAGESFIRSQQQEGWVCLPDRYDDGGFTGANMERPALRRLLADIDAGKVDCVVVYKVDRLSRSLLDFARIMESFEKHNVSFVSVTQAFNTASSMGRLILNVLLSFAQFEREMISERTRDKIAAARRKGKWAGGMPVLGYDVVQTKLVVNEVEAPLVRQIFELYLERQSMLAVLKEIDARGWRTKQWTTRKGTCRGGRSFDKSSIYQLLTNIAYIGKIRYKEEVHEGEHQAIVDPDVFDLAQTILKRNGRSGGRGVRNKHGALLRGLLRCGACKCAMSHSFSTKRNRQYRYYVCDRAQKRGWKACPAPSIPAGEIERVVIDEIKCIGRDPSLMQEILIEARRHSEQQSKSLRSELSSLHRQLERDRAKVETTGQARDSRLTEAQDRIGNAERRVTEIHNELITLEQQSVDEHEVVTALADFDTLWNDLAPREQVRLVGLLVECVTYDATAGNVSITFRPTGIKALLGEMAKEAEDAA